MKTLLTLLTLLSISTFADDGISNPSKVFLNSRDSQSIARTMFEYKLRSTNENPQNNPYKSMILKDIVCSYDTSAFMGHFGQGCEIKSGDRISRLDNQILDFLGSSNIISIDAMEYSPSIVIKEVNCIMTKKKVIEPFDCFIEFYEEEDAERIILKGW